MEQNGGPVGDGVMGALPEGVEAQGFAPDTSSGSTETIVDGSDDVFEGRPG